MWSDTDDSLLVIRGISWVCPVQTDLDIGSCEPGPSHHEIWIRPLDGGEERQLLPRRDGWAAVDSYFMKSAGYILLHHRLEGESNWEQISLDGDIRIVEQANADVQPGGYVPSPDGTILARVSWSDCDTGQEPTTCIYRVSFVDAGSLEAIGDEVVHRATGPAWSDLRMTWNPDGTAIYVGIDVFEVGVDGRVETNVVPIPCPTSMRTTSGLMASDGRQLAPIGLQRGEFNILEGAEPGYPDRCFPPAELAPDE